MFKYFNYGLWLTLGLSFICAAASAQLSYFELIEQAIAVDPLIKAEQKHSEAAQLQAQTNAQWADPQWGLSLANLPSRGSMRHQEGMTQLKLSLSQTLPRGDSLSLGTDIFQLRSNQAGLKAQLRARKLRRDVGMAWLQLHLAYTRRHYVNQSHSIIGELVEVVQAHYGAGKHHLQDVVAAQVEQSRLALKLSQIDAEIAALQASFTQWLLPSDLALSHRSKLPGLNLPPQHNLKQQLLLHPQLALLQYEVNIGVKTTELARQKLQSQYSIHGSYGLRAQDIDGHSRADLLSVGVKMTMPLFATAKQDAQVAANVLKTEAKQAQKGQMLDQMEAQYQTTMAQLKGWQQQLSLYEQNLLEQLNIQVELALNAYNHDEGEFAALLRAYLAQMNGNIEYAKIKIAMLNLTTQIHYLLLPLATQLTKGE